MRPKPLILGIDASNISSGGGITHLIELLQVAEPFKYGFASIIIWGSKSTLQIFTSYPWLVKHNPFLLNKGLFFRFFWQFFHLSNVARDAGCDVLFIPGGCSLSNFHPVLTMSQNLLPFDWCELRRYRISFISIRLIILQLIQTFSFRKADGVIFLTDYAREKISSFTGNLNVKSKIIPHGLNPRFIQSPRLQREISTYNEQSPFHVLYVSIIDYYKHQWHVVEAIASLRLQGLPIVLDLIGPAYPPALRRLNNLISNLRGDISWVRYHGRIPFDILHMHYAKADVGLFASSCENMPNILLETMASGLPIACSNRGPMPEILGSAGVFFDPEQPNDIACALLQLINSPRLRAELAYLSYQQAQEFSWERCADETFKYLASFSQI